MTKNLLILLLIIMNILFWMKTDPENVISSDPDDVVIEYKCSELSEYKNVPKEVVDECYRRGFLKSSV